MSVMTDSSSIHQILTAAFIISRNKIVTRWLAVAGLALSFSFSLSLSLSPAACTPCSESNQCMCGDSQGLYNAHLSLSVTCLSALVHFSTPPLSISLYLNESLALLLPSLCCSHLEAQTSQTLMATYTLQAVPGSVTMGYTNITCISSTAVAGRSLLPYPFHSVCEGQLHIWKLEKYETVCTFPSSLTYLKRLVGFECQSH